MFRSAWPVSSSLPLLEMQAALCLSRSQREGAETAGGDYKPAAVEHCVNDNSSGCSASVPNHAARPRATS